MSATLEELKTTKQPRATAKFIQITSGLPYGAALTVFALDEDGDVWQIIPGREPDEWQRLPKKRAGGPGRPASR